MNERKACVCPLRLVAGVTNAACIGDRCAWWVTPPDRRGDEWASPRPACALAWMGIQAAIAARR